MKFKVGDKVRLTREITQDDLAEVKIIFSADMVTKELGRNVFEVKDVSEEDGRICISLPSDIWWLKSEWFELIEQPKQPERVELIEQPEPQVGDVWANADKSEVVRVLGKFERNGFDFFSYFGLKGECKGVANFARKQIFLAKFPTFLHRPQKPKKQPKPVAETPKKQKEEKWEPVVAQGVASHRCFRKGNSIKCVQNGCEGIATCNKKDKFDLNFGIDLAWYRALVKFYEAMIAEMLKEGSK